MADDINHPAHYAENGPRLECQTIRRLLPQPLADCFKYCWRRNDKGTPIKDLGKALWYINDFYTHLDMFCDKHTRERVGIAQLILSGVRFEDDFMDAVAAEIKAGPLSGASIVMIKRAIEEELDALRENG